MQEISHKHPSYIEDTYDFLSKLSTAKVQPHTLLITLDVESMYTNIDNEQGLEAVRNIFQANPSPRRSDKHILELLELSLKNNDFEFNNETFRVSTNLRYCNGQEIRTQLCKSVHGIMGKYSTGKCYQKATMYFRYLDDIWILWDHGETHSPAIRLSAKVEIKIDFLDVIVFKGSQTNETGILDIKVFSNRQIPINF